MVVAELLVFFKGISCSARLAVFILRAHMVWGPEMVRFFLDFTGACLCLFLVLPSGLTAGGAVWVQPGSQGALC